VLGNLSFWQISSFAFFRYGTFVALQGLWLGTYLMAVKAFSPVQAGNILMMLSIGYIVGAPLSGYLADRVFRSPKMTALWAIILYALFLIPLTGLVDLKTPTLYGTLFFAIGFFNSFGTLAYTHVKELFPLSMSGTAIAGVNFFVMAGGAILMPLLGKVIETISAKGSSYAAQAYHLAFLICFVGMAASIVFYAFSKSRQR
jgi:sugar phosphate permease